MNLLPKPKIINYGNGEFALSIFANIVLVNTEPQAFIYAKMLQKTIREHTGLIIPILKGKAENGNIALNIDASLPYNKYFINVNPENLMLRAGSEEALCNAVQTICQCVQLCGARIPEMTIEDWPDFPTRGYYLDISRGRIPTLEKLKAYADLLYRYKINQFQLYVEHTYLFRNLSEAWRGDTPLNAQEIMELDDYCAQRYIELVPSLATFGHMYKILSTKTYCDLCELENSETAEFRYTDVMNHHTLNVSNEKSLDLVENMISEFMPLFRSRKFNICADETFDLGKGRSIALAEKYGTKTIYLKHLKTLCEFLVENGRTPMFWGDVIWDFPQAYKELPDQTICLNWGYLPNQREDEMRCVAETGALQYACPGVCGWNRWIPLYKDAYSNIKTMCMHAQKFKAIGILNTDWGDYGHINDPALSVPAVIYGASFSWNSEIIPFEEINADISKLEYNDDSGSLVDIMSELSNNEIFNWTNAVKWIESNDEKEKEILFSSMNFFEAEKANFNIQKALDKLACTARNIPQNKKDIIRILEIAAQSAIIWNEIGIFIAVNFYNIQLKSLSGSALAKRLEKWYQIYLSKRRETDKESGIPNLTLYILKYADLLRGRKPKI